MGLERVEAVLLDMDGTLVDSDGAVERAWAAWAREWDLDPAAVAAVAHGFPSAVTVRRLLPGLGGQDLVRARERHDALEREDDADVVAARGARELVEALERLDLPWGVVTSASGALARARLRAAGLAPPLVLTLDDVAAGKPDPEGYLQAARRLGVDPSRCLVVEDSEPGLDAGRAAGAVTAALRGLDGDLRIGDLGELAELLEGARGRTWWEDATGYQVYLPSFADSDGDGWGDLRGATSRLDHLASLGVDVVWLSPFHPSPMRDHGYDVADHRGVDPRFGTHDDLDVLLREAHRRGLRVLGDLVVNHTSDRHPWFLAARRGRDDPHRSFYVWRDPAPDGGPPNNWLSHFGGPAWTLDPGTGQYYLHLFRPEQPDLNWRSPAVADEVDGILEHWLSRGLDGFRIDTAAYLVKHPELLDNPLLPDGELSPVRGVTDAWRRQDHRFDVHQPDVHAIHERWRRVADRHGAFLVGEVYELDPVALAAYVGDERLHSSFWFGLVEADWDPGRIDAMVRSAAAASGALSWVQGNHDRPRAASRYGGGTCGRGRSLALHVLMAFLPGTLWLFQGEELGLEDGVVPEGLEADPLGLAQPSQSRDGARTPMPWAPGPGLGFTSGRPWLPDAGRRLAETAAVQGADPGSHLQAMRRLLMVKRWARERGVARGEVRFGPPGAAPAADGAGAGAVAAYRRGRTWVMANLGDEPRAPVAVPGACVFDSADPAARPECPGRAPAVLAPRQAVVLVEEGP
jgi:alpha-glucosidase